MAFLSDIFGRVGRVARGQANAGVDAMEDATFEATVRQTVADMKTELNNVVRASAMAMSNYNTLQAEYDKYVRQSQEWKDRAGMALDAGNEDLAKKALGGCPFLLMRQRRLLSVDHHMVSEVACCLKAMALR